METIQGGAGERKSKPLLEIRDVSKTFHGVKALDDVCAHVSSGEVVALVGQNGSGKSTLVKVLAGVYEADPGSEVVRAEDDGEQVSLHFIHQDLGLVDQLSTVENLDLDRRLGRSALLPARRRSERSRAAELIARFGGSFDVEAPVKTLSAAERTIAAIARALDRWEHPRNVLILDEPTASLHGDEVGKLFDAVRRVASAGAGVIFISHRLDEVIELADRVVVLRDGRVVEDVARGAYDHDDLVELIVGSALAKVEPSGGTARSDRHPVLSARGITGRTVAGVDLDLYPGEILGVSGVLGSGREQMASVLFGCTGAVERLEVGGELNVGPMNPRRAIALGMAFVPGERRREGAVMRMSVRENLTLPQLRSLRGRFGNLETRRELAETRDWIDRVDVRPPESERALEFFSGGNQQKVVLAKWLRTDPRVLLLDEPTQGVDVGAKAGIFALIAAAARAGAGVLVCSSDAKELATICDRVVVLADGRVVAEATSEITEAALVRAGLGHAPPDVQPGTRPSRSSSEVNYVQ